MKKKILPIFVIYYLTSTITTLTTSNYTIVKPQKSEEKTIFWLNQGSGGNSCDCSVTYDSKSGNSGCEYCPLECYKYSTGPNSFGCKTCRLGCSSCDNFDSCRGCKGGYYKVDSLCEKCKVSGCRYCSGPEIKCNECDYGYFPDGSNCGACGEKCEICSNKTSCNRCASWHDWNAEEKKCIETPMWKRILIWTVAVTIVILFFIGFCYISSKQSSRRMRLERNGYTEEREYYGNYYNGREIRGKEIGIFVHKKGRENFLKAESMLKGMMTNGGKITEAFSKKSTKEKDKDKNIGTHGGIY